jgi:hypothetical protein
VRPPRTVHGAIRLARDPDGAGRDDEFSGAAVEPARGRLDQVPAGGGRGLAQRHGGDLDRLAGDRAALVGGGGGAAELHGDPGEGHVELLGDDLGQRRADAGAEIDVAVEGGDPARAVDREVERALRPRGQACARRVAEAGRAAHRLAVDEQQVVRFPPVPALGTAAARTARRISIWVPQRHRLFWRLERISASPGSGLADSSATVVMIMPFRQ